MKLFGLRSAWNIRTYLRIFGLTIIKNKDFDSLVKHNENLIECSSRNSRELYNMSKEPDFYYVMQVDGLSPIFVKGHIKGAERDITIKGFTYGELERANNLVKALDSKK